MIEVVVTKRKDTLKGVYDPTTKAVRVLLQRPGTWLEAGGGWWDGTRITQYQAQLPEGLLPLLEAELKKRLAAEATPQKG